MVKINTKSIITIIIVLLVIAGIGELANTLANKHSKSTSASKSNVNTPVLNPTTVLEQPANYANATVRVKGFVLQAGPDYYIVGQKTTDSSTSRPASIRLDFSGTKIDPKKYAVNTSNDTGRGGNPSTATNNSLVITGKLTQTKGAPITIIVSSLQP